MAAPLRVVWASFAPLTKTATGLTSEVASVRYRMTVPAAALAAAGLECKVVHLNASAKRSTLLDRFEGSHAVVLGKLLSFDAVARFTLELVAELRARGVKVLADFSDDHFMHPKTGPVYRALANAVDRVTVSTPGLGEVLAANSASPVSVITDPVEGQRGEPRAQPLSAGRPMSLLWFGHPSNLDTLKHALRQLEPAKLPYSLTLVTTPRAGGEAIVREVSAQWQGTGRTCRLVPWSVAAVFQALRECDAVVIPSDPYDYRKQVKSPNRFTESVWAGRFVLAHPLPAYEALADYGWVGEDLGEGLRWYAQSPEAARKRIEQGQAAIAERFTPQAVAAEWQAAIAAALEGE
jgi:hypothetical protein